MLAAFSFFLPPTPLALTIVFLAHLMLVCVALHDEDSGIVLVGNTAVVLAGPLALPSVCVLPSFLSLTRVRGSRGLCVGASPPPLPLMSPQHLL